MVKKVLITGGAGFIGSHVAERFPRRGYDVYIVDNLSTGKKENVREKAVEKIFVTDILNVERLIQIFEEISPDIVIHMAAQPSLLTSIERPVQDLSVNGLGTLIIAKFCKHYKVKKLVYASTSAVMDSEIQYPDNSIIWQRTPKNPYGISKLIGEIYIKYFLPDSIILRLGNVYGPRQVPLGENQLIPRAIRYALDLDEFEIYGSGNQTRDYVFVEDVANAFYLASKSEKAGIFYVGTGKPATVLTVLHLISNAFNKTIDWPRGEARDQRENINLYISPTQDALGWKAKVALGQGIARTVKWWQEKYGN